MPRPGRIEGDVEARVRTDCQSVSETAQVRPITLDMDVDVDVDGMLSGSL